MRYLAITITLLMSFSSFAHAGTKCDQVMENIRDIIVEEFSLAEVTIELEPETFCPQLELTNGTDAAAAIREALKSFMNDDDDIESPLSLLTSDAFDALGMDYEHPTPVVVLQKAKELVLDYMNRETSVLRFMSLKEQAEHGETVHDNWVVNMKMDDYSDHLFFAIIDRSGERKVYNYGFN